MTPPNTFADAIDTVERHPDFVVIYDEIDSYDPDTIDEPSDWTSGAITFDPYI